jgi:hypothetical protein
MSSNKA